MRKRIKWFLIIVLAVGLSYAGYSLFMHTEVEYLTVSEAQSRAESSVRQTVRVEGNVVPGSISWDEKAQVISFALTDDKESLPVVYKGMVPDNFKPGTALVVEGSYRADGIFEALSFGRRRSVCNLCHS